MHTQRQIKGCCQCCQFSMHLWGPWCGCKRVTYYTFCLGTKQKGWWCSKKAAKIAFPPFDSGVYGQGMSHEGMLSESFRGFCIVLATLSEPMRPQLWQQARWVDARRYLHTVQTWSNFIGLRKLVGGRQLTVEGNGSTCHMNHMKLSSVHI